MKANGNRCFSRRAIFAAGLALGVAAHAATAVADAPLAAPAPVVEQPLAPAAADVPGEQPSAEHVWVPGHWRWHEGAYVWEAGRWEVPPAPNHRWRPPQWRKQGSGYVLHEGYWGEAPPSQASAAEPPLPWEQEMVVSAPPPAPRKETVHGRPTPAHVWVAGYWRWNGARYEWVAGHWVVPPRRNALWVPPRWEQRGEVYVFISGYWRDAVIAPPPAPGAQALGPAASSQVVVVPRTPPQIVVVAAPPPPRREVVYVRPSARHVWLPGYWAWQGGRYVWFAGRYAMPPRGFRTWHSPRWERRGGTHVFIEGRWGR